MNSPLGSQKYKIGIDASCLYRYDVGGMETYINNLLLELQQLNHPQLEFIRLKGPQSLQSPSSSSAINFIREIGWLHWGIDGAAKRLGIHLLHLPAHLHAPWTSVPQVATLHDAHVYIAPGTHPFPIAQYIKLFTWMAGKKAIRIVTPSQNAKEDLIRYHHVPAEKIAVTYLGSRRFPTPPGAHPHPDWKPYLFYLGVMKPHKNLPMLLRTFARMIQEPDLKHYHLVLGGPQFGSDADVLRREIPRLGLQDRVHMIGSQTDEQLSHWYGGAALAVLPSLNEGFGHMPIEAMQFGTPVAVSKVGAIPEIVKNAAEFINNPTDPEDMYQVITGLLRNETRRKELSRIGKERAAEFTWKRHAERMIEVYTSVLRELGHSIA